MLGRFLLFSLCVFFCNGFSFEKEATALLKSQGIDLSDLAAGSTTGERKDALQAALGLVRKQLVQQVTDIKTDFGKREAARLAIKNKKLQEAGAAKVAYDAALGTYNSLRDLSNKADVNYKVEKEDDLEETNRLTANLNSVIGTLTGVLNGRPVRWASDGWTGWVNGWDAVLHQGTDPQRAFCGLGGVHDNHREDRLFQVSRCRPTEGSLLSPSTSDQKEVKLPITGYRQAWTRECPTNQYLSSLYSVHNNGQEDRIWTFGCKSFYQISTTTCAWTGWLNGYDAQFRVLCPNSRVLAGIKGEYSPPHRDRRFAIKCCDTKRQII